MAAFVIEDACCDVDYFGMRVTVPGRFYLVLQSWPVEQCRI